jgi:DNA (cytosine-5)-methyltransferase 1
LAGKKSGLFYEAIRIINEMKEAPNGAYPAFAGWENVPYALHRIRDVMNTFQLCASPP